MRELWWSFVTDVNRALLVVLDTLENLGTRGWLWIGLGLWLLSLYVWIRDLPGAIRFLYFLVLVFYFIGIPLWIIGTA